MEGLLAFYESRIEQLLDKKIFIEIPKTLFLERKVRDKRWGEFPEWYMEHIWQSYLTYGKINLSKKGYFTIKGEEITISDDLIAYLFDE